MPALVLWPPPEIVSAVVSVGVVVAAVVAVVVVVVVAAAGGNFLQLWPPHLRLPPTGQLRSLRGLQSLSSRSRFPESCRTHPQSPFCPFPHLSPRLLLLSPGIWTIYAMVKRD